MCVLTAAEKLERSLWSLPLNCAMDKFSVLNVQEQLDIK